jgi:uncharacterized protein (DUF2237 family)
MDFKKAPSLNVFGETLEACSTQPMTGFFRNGACETCAEDRGSHTVCCTMTAEFLAFSKYVGNDLSTPRPEYNFAGLKPGDGWCVCASRWLQAAEEGAAPLVNLAATHQRALEVISMEMLETHAVREES